MNLRILLPTEILVDVPVAKIVAEAENGSFCLLPRHVDHVAALVPGILSFTPVDGEERYAAIAEGILVKSGPDVRISTRDATIEGTIEVLERAVIERFSILDERERIARSAIAKLEADFLRRFLEFGEASHA